MAKRFSIRGAIERRWYGKPGALLLLWPLEKLFGFISSQRRKKHSLLAQKYPVPVVVVGNISVGGTGKTPTIIALVQHLKAAGRTPGVVSRGYGRVKDNQQQTSSDSVIFVNGESSAEQVGDEPLLIYRSNACEVAVCDDRSRAIEALYEQKGCDIVLADDGLQHYKMSRDAEIVVVDGERKLGNGHLLPVGPLREPPARLQNVDWVLVNMPSSAVLDDVEAGLDTETGSGYACVDEVGSHGIVPGGSSPNHVFPIQVVPTHVYDIATTEKHPCSILAECENVVAVVGLGNPNKFFHTLDTLGIDYETRIFPDHHHYCEADFADLADKTLVMTEKDAVKCRELVKGLAFALAVEMQLPDSFLNDFSRKVEQTLR